MFFLFSKPVCISNHLNRADHRSNAQTYLASCLRMYFQARCISPTCITCYSRLKGFTLDDVFWVGQHLIAGNIACMRPQLHRRGISVRFQSWWDFSTSNNVCTGTNMYLNHPLPITFKLHVLGETKLPQSSCCVLWYPLSQNLFCLFLHLHWIHSRRTVVETNAVATPNIIPDQDHQAGDHLLLSCTPWHLLWLEYESYWCRLSFLLSNKHRTEILMLSLFWRFLNTVNNRAQYHAYWRLRLNLANNAYLSSSVGMGQRLVKTLWPELQGPHACIISTCTVRCKQHMQMGCCCDWYV